MTEADRLEKWAGVPRELAELVVTFSERYGFSVGQIRGPSRVSDCVWIRRSIAKIARRRETPFSFWQIGRALNRDSSTVQNLVTRSRSTRNGSNKSEHAPNRSRVAA
jgi:chromosomal replication initiation ATPase DnaA